MSLSRPPSFVHVLAPRLRGPAGDGEVVDDERVPVESLVFGQRVLGDLLRTC